PLSPQSWSFAMSGSVSSMEGGEKRASIFTSATHLTGNDRKAVTWQHISATVPVKKKGAERKQVLNEVFGVANCGEVLAIMGASGAGKTTLMNILAKQKSAVVQATGTVKVNGVTVSDREMQMQSAYVQQVDVFCGSITVREQLIFSAKLRLPETLTDDERMQRVDSVVRQMNLTDCQNTMIGIPGRVKGISIGEKKRLAFASEVLTDPSILFCDEPTSGLDSFMASQVVSALKEMASTGKTIITVIHQPSSEVFNMFDTVCFMASGKPAYHGPIKDVCPFFASLGRPELCVPESYNPADHAITQISMNPETKDADLARITHIRETFEKSELGKQMMATADPLKEVTPPMETDAKSPKKKSRYATGFFRQLRVLCMRSFLTTLRDPVVLRVRCVQIVLTAIIISIVSWNTPITGPTVMNLEGVLYNVARDMNFLFLFPSVNFITAELPLFFREHKARIYSVESYYAAKSLAELPQYTILPFVYSIIVYWCTGLVRNFGRFMIFSAISILQVWVATSIAYAGACIFGEEGLAVSYIPLYILPMLIFGGFYINYDSIPKYFQWLSYLSWFRYGFESLQINQWMAIDSIQGCPKDNGTLPLDCTASDGVGLLKRRGQFADQFIPDVMILIAFFFIYRAIGFIALYLRAKYQKSSA
ncbi:wht-4, partial [Pristionchus pacificus]